jgi:RNA polymerase sigma-70 factor, ECF subfamily
LPEQARGYSGRGSFEGWIRRVAARLALLRLRRRARRRETALDADALGGSTTCADRTLHDTDLERALARLPESLRTVFVLREIEGFTHTEIATMLGIRSGTSEVRLNRARQQLRKLLER